MQHVFRSGAIADDAQCHAEEKARLGLINPLQSIAFAACTCMQCCVMVESFVVLGGSGRHEMERRRRCRKSFVQCIRAAAGSYMGFQKM